MKSDDFIKSTTLTLISKKISNASSTLTNSNASTNFANPLMVLVLYITPYIHIFSHKNKVLSALLIFTIDFDMTSQIFPLYLHQYVIYDFLIST